MHVSFTTAAAGACAADTIAIGVLEGEQLPGDSPAQVSELLARGEAKHAFKSLALTHAEDRRWLLVGLGSPRELTPERARAAAAAAVERAREIGTRTLCWELPGAPAAALARALVEGTVLADYRFEAFKSNAAKDGEESTKHLDGLLISAAGQRARRMERTWPRLFGRRRS